MDPNYLEYITNMRNLVKHFIHKYKDEKFDDDYKAANEFLENYSFGFKLGKPEKIIELEFKFQESLEKMMNITTVE